MAAELSAANWQQLWVPPGFLHGFVTLEPDCEVIYKTTGYYDKASERAMRVERPRPWRSPWPVTRRDAVRQGQGASEPGPTMPDLVPAVIPKSILRHRRHRPGRDRAGGARPSQ